MFRNHRFPESISNNDLLEATLEIFDKLDVTIDAAYIEDCHWLKSNESKKVERTESLLD